MKAKQERTLTEGIHISTYFMCTKFDILNYNGFLTSGGCRSVKLFLQLLKFSSMF